MAKTYSEEDVAQKTNGTAIPKTGLALFVVLAVVFIVLFMVLRNRQPVATDPGAIQNAPLANPTARDGGG